MSIIWRICLFALALVAVPAGAGEQVRTIELYPHDPQTSAVLSGGAYAWMKYKATTGRFVLNARRLRAGTEFTLVQYIHPWPRRGMVCLGSASADEHGRLRISGEIPSTPPTDFADVAEPSVESSLWIVPAADIDCNLGQLDECIRGRCTPWLAWHPEDLLTSFPCVSPLTGEGNIGCARSGARRPTGINPEVLRALLDYLKPKVPVDENECLVDRIFYSKCVSLVQVQNLERALCPLFCKTEAVASGGDASECIESCAPLLDPDEICGEEPDC